MAPSEDALRDLIAAERIDQIEYLASLTTDEWSAASLCDGWRVREVVAHITMSYRYSLPRVIVGMLRARGNFDRFADRAARRDTTALSDDDLLQCMRDNVHHAWKPPGGGYAGALSHDVIHGLDITEAVGPGRAVPVDRIAPALPSGTDDRGARYFGVDLDGVTLEATDTDWSIGSGEVVSGRAQDLLLAVCGRKVPAGRLTGEHASRFER